LFGAVKGVIISTMNTHDASTVLTLANATLSGLKSAVELTKQSKDHALKNQISEVLSSFLELQVKVLELDIENRTLKSQLAQKDSIQRKGEFGYFFKDEDPDPLCPKCYEGAGKIIHLSGLKQEHGGVRRTCMECNLSFWEMKYRHPEQPRGHWMS
jgi:hypothetical protein